MCGLTFIPVLVADGTFTIRLYPNFISDSGGDGRSVSILAIRPRLTKPGVEVQQFRFIEEKSVLHGFRHLELGRAVGSRSMPRKPSQKLGRHADEMRRFILSDVFCFHSGLLYHFSNDVGYREKRRPEEMIDALLVTCDIDECIIANALIKNDLYR